MSDRLEELRRQRALLQQHLAWLDAEIAAASQSLAAPRTTSTKIDLPAPRSPAVPSPIESISLQTAPADAALAEMIAAQESAPAHSAHEAKRGCIVAFSVVLIALGAAVSAWYLYFRTRH